MNIARLKPHLSPSLVAVLAIANIIFSPMSHASDKKPLTDERKAQLTHIVKQDCGSCHGMTLKGGLGPALLPENLEGKNELFLQYTILHGRTSTAMPPWKSLLTEQEALWIAEQLKQGAMAEKAN
ncbi:c-type cytochrome [Litorilituus sediminis]|nr:cytochrome c [Litorilituus sediminis]